MPPFIPADIKTFRFASVQFSEIERLVFLNYAFDDRYYFTETLHFPGVTKQLDDTARHALATVLHELHLVAGISYYKAALPPHISIETKPLNANAAHFLNNLYLQGLGEFAYRNQLDLRNRVFFSATNETPAEKISPYWKSTDTPDPCTVLPIGGGKDSLVSLEILRAAGHPVRLFSVGKSAIMQEISKTTALPFIAVERRLDPLLFALNKQGAYNGHVPISAILAYIMAAAAILYDFDTVVMSNERSANVGNIQQNGFDINHQYSKSAAFEGDVQARFATILPGFRYFSLLRGLSELDIARQFAKTAHYDAIFSSCNANYKIHEDKTHQGHWCLNCPKCRFVFLSLAAFMPKSRLLSIFGKNLLNDPTQQSGFDALIGYHAHKPFECVGEVEESLAAFYLLSQQSDWQDDLLVKRFYNDLLPHLEENPQALLDKALTPEPTPLIPQEFLNYLS